MRTALIALVGVAAGIAFAAALHHAGAKVEAMRIGTAMCSAGRC